MSSGDSHSVRTALVTGATGFVGHALCKHLKSQECQVIAVGRTPADGPWDKFLPFNLGEHAPFPHIHEKVDALFHCAGKAHALAEIQQDNAEYSRINTHGTQQLLDWARSVGVRSMVFFSSIKAMGEGSDTPLSETSPLAPTTPYGISKLEAEKLVAASGLPHFAILRPALIYGPNAKGNLEKMMAAIERGRFPPVPETHNRRSMVCLHDVVRAAATVATHPAARSQTYVLEDGQHYSTRRLYEQMALALGKKPSSLAPPLCVFKALGLFGDLFGKIRGRRFFFDSDAVAKLFSSNVFDGSKITRDLDFSYEWTLEKALPAIVASRTP